MVRSTSADFYFKILVNVNQQFLNQITKLDPFAFLLLTSFYCQTVLLALHFVVMTSIPMTHTNEMRNKKKFLIMREKIIYLLIEVSGGEDQDINVLSCDQN